MSNEMDTLLRVESADVRHDWFEGVAQPEPFTQRPFVVVLAIQGVNPEPVRQERVDLGILNLIIDAIQHATELVLMDPERVSEPRTQLRRADLPRVAR